MSFSSSLSNPLFEVNTIKSFDFFLHFISEKIIFVLKKKTKKTVNIIGINVEKDIRF